MAVCPPVESLAQLLSGELDAAGVGAVESHVAACRHCEGILAELSDDPELRGWLHSCGDTPMADGTGLADLMCRPRTAADEPCDAGAALAFLDPPRRPGDLGVLGPYHIEAQIGRGGMGVVLRAYDEGLRRPVALKVLRPEFAHAAARQRFVREAQSAARVRHDHVVTVFAVHNPAGGLPHIAMELLEGPSLAELIRAGDVPPARAGAIVAEAAAGLAAAHAAGLVHRDVKPANILLDRATGRAKVSDFGLAYQAEAPAAGERLTEHGALLGTPAYMSPEQAQGGAVDARSDVYALGVTLYEALTGEVPFRGALHLVLRQIVADEPRPPRQLNDAIPRDLETVCLRAMARDPLRRYPSAAALADDLRRWQRGEPIWARPAGRLEKGWRWCRRNPGIAALALALALALGAGLAATSWQAYRASEAADRADADRRLAEERRADAERSLRAALRAGDDLLTSVSEEQLLRQPHLQPLRRKLLEKALDHYRALLRAHGDNPGLRRETALAAFRVGDLVDQIGSRADTAAAHADAIARLDGALAADPSDRAVHLKLVDSHLRLGLAQEQFGRAREAVASFEAAAALARALAERAPGDRDLRSNLLACYGNLANLYQRQGEHARARQTYERLRDELEAMAQAEPNHRGIARTLGLNYHNLAMMQGKLGEEAAALAGYEKAYQIRRRLVEQAPGNRLYRRDLAKTETMLAEAYRRRGDAAVARRFYQAAVTTLAQLVEEEPAALEHRTALAMAEANLGGFLADRGEDEAALDALAKGCAQYRAVLAADAKSVRALAGLALALRDAGNVHLRRGRHAAALPLLAEAITRGKAAVAASAPGAAVRATLAGSYRDYAAALRRTGKDADALAALEAGLEHARASAAQAADDPLRRRELADYLEDLAARLREHAQVDRAAALSSEQARLR